MASVVKLIANPIDLEEEIKRRDEIAESTRHLYFIEARKIQAWIRGILTRNHFRLLHESAATIQRHWRGYLGRSIADRYLVERIHQMWQDYYDEMASKIQATWRGYWVRKTVRDFPKMRRWLQTVYRKNQETVDSMKRFRRDEIQHVENMLEQESVQWVLFILFKLHHMLRTKQKPGAITRLDDTRVTFVEEMIKCLEYRHYVRRRRRIPPKKCRDCQIDKEPGPIFQGTRYERCEKEIREYEKSVQAGKVPIFRSEPYEKVEKEIRKWNQIELNAAMDESVETKRERDQNRLCSLIKEFDNQASCMPAGKLYEKIEKMACHLKQFHLNCPVHDSPCST